ncbi:NfeD family protein [Gemmobacter caeruleus]|uniref:NfeD family protein n=1 Tax=Gemmobacter caeruleus TaxID=2595004 RepID=UPI0011EE756D|nr:hypothetical protein [Gemmobacter caeruleus]
MTWWMWIVAGMALGGLELFMPGYVFLGFAIGAVLVGGLLWTGWVTLSLAAQLALFAVLSLLAWAVLRAVLRYERGEVKRWTRDIND